MDDRTLEELRGKMVVLIARMQTELGDLPFNYYGKLSAYDSKSLTLNPYFEWAECLAAAIESKPLIEFQGFSVDAANQQAKWFKKARSLLDAIKDVEAGSADKEITFDKGKVEYVHRLRF